MFLEALLIKVLPSQQNERGRYLSKFLVEERAVGVANVLDWVRIVLF
jgi:hypothetical protein